VPLRLYADIHIPRPAIHALRAKHVDVITAQDDSADTLDDDDLLSRATSLDRILVTQDQDFQAIAASRLRERRDFAGIIYISPQHVGLSAVVSDLELCALALDPEDLLNRVEHLPL
jgi:hypothetical protein